MKNGTSIAGRQTALSKSANLPSQLWQIDISPANGLPDRIADEVLDNARFALLPDQLKISASRGFLIQGDIDRRQVERLASELLVDSVVEQAIIAPVGDDQHGGIRADIQIRFMYCPCPVSPTPKVKPPWRR